MQQTLFLISLFTTFFCCGQIYQAQNDSFKTKIEQAANAKNVLIKREFIDLARIKRVDFKFLKVYNIETKTISKGLYISPKSRLYKKTHYLDSTEIIAFFNYLLAMDTTKYNFNLRDEVRYNIVSKDNFNLVMSYGNNDWEWKYSLFINKKKLKKKGRKMNKEKFQQLIAVFGKARSLL